MRKKFLFLFLLFLVTHMAFGEEEAKGPAAEPGPAHTPAAKADTKKVLSKFEEEVMREVDKRVQRAQGENMARLFKELLEKEKELKDREAAIVNRNEQLRISEEDLVKRIKKLEQDQQEILGCIKKNEESENDRAKQMVDIISNMRPAKAAEILSVQDLPLAVKIFGMLDPNKSSKIFNLMDKEISARIQKMYLTMKK